MLSVLSPFFALLSSCIHQLQTSHSIRAIHHGGKLPQSQKCQSRCASWIIHLLYGYFNGHSQVNILYHFAVIRLLLSYFKFHKNWKKFNFEFVLFIFLFLFIILIEMKLLIVAREPSMLCLCLKPSNYCKLLMSPNSKLLLVTRFVTFTFLNLIASSISQIKCLHYEQRDWTISGSNVVFGKPEVAKNEIPSRQLIQESLTYAKELERIV